MFITEVTQSMIELHIPEITFVLMLLLLPFLYDASKTFRYHSRFLFYYITVSITAIGCIPLFALNPMNVKNCMYISTVLKQISKLLGIRWELRGGEILAEDKGFVIIANHQSSLDILGMFDFWRVMDKCAAIARKEVFYVWPFGIAAWLAGVVFIDRENSEKAKAQLNQTSDLMRKKRVKLWIFPEGTRNLNKPFLPFKKGAFRVAIACQVPIVPVVFSPYYFLNPKKKFFGSGKVIVTALPPIPTEGLTYEDMPQLMETARNRMMKVYDQVSKELRVQLPPNYPGLDQW